MANFIYLFRNNPANLQSLSPEQMQQILKKWMDWKESLEKTSQAKVPGERLESGGKVVKGKGKAVTDGPYVEVKDFIQGYMIVSARDIDHAVELAKACPILESEGSVEVRPVLTM